MARSGWSTSNYLSGTNAVASNTYPFTFSAWFNCSSVTGSPAIVAFCDSTSARCEAALTCTTGSALQAINVWTTFSSGTTTTSTFSLNKWNHAAGVFPDAHHATPYLNGATSGSNTDGGSGSISWNNLSIGALKRSTVSQPFNGSLGEVAAWNVSLTAAEIAALATGVPAYLIRPASIVGYWPVYGLASAEPDFSGKANNMSITGSLSKANGPPVTLFTPRWTSNPTKPGITVTVDSMVGWESSLTLLRDTPAPYEVAASLVRDTPIPLESFATVRRDASAPIEALATVLVDNDAPTESLITARQDAGTPNELAATTRADASLPSESGVNITFDERVSVEITRGFTDDNLAPIEWLGTAEISVTADGHVPLEWLAAKSADGTIGLEASAKVQVDNQLSSEFLATLAAQAVVPLSAVASIVASGNVPAEFTGTVRSDGGVPTSFSASIQFDRKTQIESSITVRIDGDVPSEWQATINLAPGGFAPLEWQLRSVNDSAVPTEFGGVRLTLDATRRFTILTPPWAYAATLPPNHYTAMAPLQQRYTALIPGNNMPALRDLPPIDAVVQTQTIAIDFGIFLPPGVTLTGTPTVTLTTTSGEDPSPSSRLKGSPVVGTVPAIQGGSEITNTAVLQQVTNVVGGVRYLIHGYCDRSDGDTASGYTHFNGNTPN